MLESNIYHSESYLWEPERAKKQSKMQLVMQINTAPTGPSFNGSKCVGRGAVSKP